MAAAFTMLFAKISAVLTWVGALYVAVFVALWDWVRGTTFKERSAVSVATREGDQPAR